MEGRQKRRPRFRRTSGLPPIRLTERDRLIISFVQEHRFLRTSHILRLVPGSRQNLLRRLQRLYHAGFLDRPRAQLPPLISGELREMVYSRASQSTQAAAVGIPGSDHQTDSQEGIERISGLFLAHALSVSDVMVAFEAACRPPNSVRLVKEADLLPFKAAQIDPKSRFCCHVTVKAGGHTDRVGVIPDAVFALESTNQDGWLRRSFYFLEADRGTMPIKRQSLALSSIYRKALAYIETRRSGIVNEQFGIPAYRVLFVTKNRERMQHMMQACKEANSQRDSTMFLFTTQSEIDSGTNILLLPWQTTKGEEVYLI